MTSTLLDKITSKIPCVRCGQKKIIQTTVSTREYSFYGAQTGEQTNGVCYVCLACNYEVFENESQRKIRERLQEEDIVNFWTPGVIVLTLMIFTILAIQVERTPVLTVKPTATVVPAQTSF